MDAIKDRCGPRIANSFPFRICGEEGGGESLSMAPTRVRMRGWGGVWVCGKLEILLLRRMGGLSGASSTYDVYENWTKESLTAKVKAGMRLVLRECDQRRIASEALS